MNIFATSSDAELSALWLDDVRKNKMIVESAQLLSTAMNMLDGEHDMPVYRTTHYAHPCSVWTRDSPENFKWLLLHLESLCDQWGPHKTASLIPFFHDWISDFDWTGERTQFVNCTADYKHVEDTHLAYRLQMNDKWNTDTIRLSWKRGAEPDWRK